MAHDDSQASLRQERSLTFFVLSENWWVSGVIIAKAEQICSNSWTTFYSSGPYYISEIAIQIWPQFLVNNTKYKFDLKTEIHETFILDFVWDTNDFLNEQIIIEDVQGS